MCNFPQEIRCVFKRIITILQALSVGCPRRPSAIESLHINQKNWSKLILNRINNNIVSYKVNFLNKFISHSIDCPSLRILGTGNKTIIKSTPLQKYKLQEWLSKSRAENHINTLSQEHNLCSLKLALLLYELLFGIIIVLIT